MHEAVEDRVRKGGVADQVVPVLDGELAGDERGAAAVAILQDFEEVAPLEVAERREAPIIKQEQVGLGEGGEQLRVGAVGPGERQLWSSRGTRAYRTRSPWRQALWPKAQAT